MKLQVNLEYRKALMAGKGVKEIEVENLLDWTAVDMRLSKPTSLPGQTSKLELLILVAFAGTLKPGDIFLEIGTYDGNTAMNCAVNLKASSKVITIDLPEDGLPNDQHLRYDAELIQSPARVIKKCAYLANVQQIYANSNLLDFSALNFSMAFIDGDTIIQQLNLILKMF